MTHHFFHVLFKIVEACMFKLCKFAMMMTLISICGNGVSYM
jgi:hypothetical protein